MSTLAFSAPTLSYRSSNVAPGIWILPEPPMAAPRPAQPKRAENFSSEIPGDEECDGWLKLTAGRMALAFSPRKSWASSTATSVPTSSAIRAYRLLKLAMQNVSRPTAPYVVPCADGSLQFEWHLKSTEFELYFEKDGSLSAWAHNRETGYEFEAEGAAARDLFLRWASELSEDDRQCNPQPVQEAVPA